MASIQSPEDRKLLKGMIVEMTHSLERIEGEKEQIKDIAESAKSKFDISPKLVKKMARTMFKHNYADLQSENDDFELLYETIIEGK